MNPSWWNICILIGSFHWGRTWVMKNRKVRHFTTKGKEWRKVSLIQECLYLYSEWSLGLGAVQDEGESFGVGPGIKEGHTHGLLGHLDNITASFWVQLILQQKKDNTLGSTEEVKLTKKKKVYAMWYMVCGTQCSRKWQLPGPTWK